MTQNERYSERDRTIDEYEFCKGCALSTCRDCSAFREMTEVPNISYSTLLKKTISEKNKLLFKKMAITVVSFLVSVVNFSRIADFKEDQLYLETVLAVLLYYLATFDISGSAALLIGELFHWYLAFGTRSKCWTVLIMTCLQVKIESVRYYEWFTMVEHLLISCVIIYLWPPTQTNYVSFIMCCLTGAILDYVAKVGIYLEESLLIVILVLASHYYKTGNHEDCYFKENISILIIWIAFKETRKAMNYTRLKLF